MTPALVGKGVVLVGNDVVLVGNDVVLVGNDVVDLDAVPAHDERRRDRFVLRVCAESERAALARAAHPDELLWELFAAKEAAYKVAAKVAPRPFAHRAFVVATDRRSVQVGERLLHLELERHGRAVHAVASTAPFQVRRALRAISPGEDASRAARALLVETLAPALGCDPRDLAVVRPEVPGSWDGFGPPRVTLRGEPLATDVSLSHDGRFVAVAAAS